MPICYEIIREVEELLTFFKQNFGIKQTSKQTTSCNKRIKKEMLVLPGLEFITFDGKAG